MSTDENYGLQHMAGEQFNDTSEDQITSAEAWNIMQEKIGELQRAKEELLEALGLAELYLPKGMMNPTSAPLTTVRAAIEAHK